MLVLYENTTNYKLDENTLALINKCIEKTISIENFTNDVEISLSIVDNKTIKHLNYEYRNINKETDVLSFPLIDDFNNINNTKYPIALGDIIISVDKAIHQAKQYGHSLQRELCFLTVHSMLHLLGYDHITEEEEEVMFEKQDVILNSLNIRR